MFSKRTLQYWILFHVCSVLLGALCAATAVAEEVTQADSSKTLQPRKLFSSPEFGIDDNLSNENLQKLITILENHSKESVGGNGDSGKTPINLEHAASYLLPELRRIRSTPATAVDATATTTTTASPQRITTRRFYRRLRRRNTTITESSQPTGPSKAEESTPVALPTGPSAESSARLLETASPSELLQQLSLLNGILGALNSTKPGQPATPTSTEVNAIDSNATPIPDIIALLTSAKQMAEPSSKSEVIVPPPSPPPKPQVSDPAAALALLNLFSGSSQNKDTSGSSNAAAASVLNTGILNLMAQSQAGLQATTPAPAQNSDADATAALTKLLLQASASAPATSVLGNSIVQTPSQPQTPNAGTSSANQLNNLLGLLGALGSTPQQGQSGNINNLFNLGGDQLAQAQTNSLSSLFGSQQQQQQQPNLLNIFGGGNQANNGFNFANLLAPSTGNSIPGLGLLSTVSGLGSSIFSTVSNIFGGSRQDGKPRVRGKGVDTRVGLGYRLGNVGDAQVVWEIGPQLFTDPLRNENRPYTQKRESGQLASPYYQGAAATAAAEKEMQQITAKRRMVQSAIQEQYRNDNFASAYPQTSQRRSSAYSSISNGMTPPPIISSPSASSSLFNAIPFADHFRGFWTGLTSGFTSGDNDSASHTRYNFDDVKTDFSNNLMKRSSPDFTEYESRAYHLKRRSDDLDDPSHTTLTDYERMLLQYGKDIGVADTKHGVVEEPQEPGFFARWFSFPSPAPAKPSPASRPAPAQRRMDWGSGSRSSENLRSNLHKPQPSSFTQSQSFPYGVDMSFNRRNDVSGRSQQAPSRRSNPRPPQKRRSHNPFRNWISPFKSFTSRPRPTPAQTGGFGRRQYTRPSGGNPKLQHFTNMNKDLLMADANDDFVESAGIESFRSYHQPLSYHYAQEFPDVALTDTPGRLKSSSSFNPTRATLSDHEKIVEPALLYDHLDVAEEDDAPIPDVDESFHNRNKVVVNPVLREMEKKKVLGTTVTKHQKTMTKIQKVRINNKNRTATASSISRPIVIKNKGTSRHKPVTGSKDGSYYESTTALPSVLSTIGGIFSGTTKPKLKTLLHNATSFLPSIRILPRKKNSKKADNTGKTKLTIQNGKPAVVVPMMTEIDDEEDLEAEADEIEPVVQVGHDMSFGELQALFSAQKKNDTKRKRLRIRVKESVLKGEDSKEVKAKKGDDDDNDGTKDIFVDIDSGEVSVLKPVANLVSFSPKKEEESEEEEAVDYYEDDDGDGVPDVDMKRKEHIFDAIQTQLVNNFEKLRKAHMKAEAKKRRKQELNEKGMDESIDDVAKYFDLIENSSPPPVKPKPKPKFAGGLAL